MKFLGRYPGVGWMLSFGDWSLRYAPEGDDGWRPLSERYGTTRTWWLWRLSLRRHGRMTERAWAQEDAS